ncbi:MAG: PEP-CTERM sorting domain-containing protein [Microcystis aeruginosa K13-05]|jgi:hypothetical protein|uniref:PEP-CTERM sorting domain-containing protein n=1 Tax=unclassified Microcystis TaxID=2643300 RepID=UPI0022BDA2E1|nr:MULTISPECIES: PEP-CTERM sorting domain-containing protein [unclassified Microcystis]MCZ8049311.1 PEP-CTERM sorting domain-containing protein [Microcystis sp. LE19-41.2A]MCZ8289218.1 PEP-CTERM sorting domain-containing protein [Microcystis sp. LE19-59.1C]NCR81377.1 PEP-CTERM sorting domain-containing protein [Microcystis aeruginosa K13-10]NCR87055.1 PEP-CTERM sorting domain-containing protein [Microcystis aeruginosa K13-05]
MINTRLKPVTTGLIGAVGLGVALLGMPEAVKAATVVAGTDYLSSPAGSNFVTIDGLGTVQLKGLPFGPGNTDTTVERQADCVFNAGTCNIPIEMTNLSLISIDPVAINGQLVDLFVKIAPGSRSTGIMTINQDHTFSSVLNLDWQVLAAPVGSGMQNAICVAEIAALPGFEADCSLLTPDQLTASGSWGSTPPPGAVIVKGPVGDQTANLHTNLGADQMDFFLIGDVEHNHRDYAANHTVRQAKVPEPSTVLGLIAVGLSSIVGFKGKKEPK